MLEIITKNDAGHWDIQYSDQMTQTPSIQQFLRQLLINQLTTVEGRLNATRHSLKRKRDIPLMINNHQCLMPLPNHQCPERMYINVCAVKDIKHTQSDTKIHFYSGNIIALKGDFRTLKKRLSKSLCDLHYLIHLNTQS